MKVIIVENALEGAKVGFKIIENMMEDQQLKTLGLATGSTPETLYQKLVESDLDFSDVVSINLDEYVGIESTHSQSYHTFMNQNLFQYKPFKVNYLPNGMEEDAEKETQNYDRIIKENPIDLQILGIGINGHIGFNEPGTEFNSLTQKVSLTPSTILANARNFKDEKDVPRYAYSMGIQSIMSAKKIILFAYGHAKEEAVYQTLEGPIDPSMPASALRNHPDVTFIIDQDAATLLK